MRSRPVVVGGALLAGVLSVAAPPAAGQGGARLEADVREALRGERALRGLEVQVTGSEATLSGALDTFWLKHEAIRRALEVDGIETVASEIELPPPESDEDLAEEVARAVQNYPHNTFFDYLDGRIQDGVVTLIGRVTPERDKAGEIFERVAKVRGVQDIRNEIGTLGPSSVDADLRNTLARRIFSSTHFQRFAGVRNPPFRLIVERSVVTLVGYVQGEIERREMEQIARHTQGVLRVINDLQTVQ